MTRIVRKETRQRGIFGWLFLVVFWLFNLLMLAWLVGGLMAVSQVEVTSSAEATGRAVGGFVGVTMIMTIWVAGAVILGLFALLTRGRKTIVEEQIG